MNETKQGYPRIGLSRNWISFESGFMKAIILAAGMGTRLGKYTKNIPKAMLSFKGKTLLQREVEALKSAGIKEIIVVCGYMPEKITANGKSAIIKKIMNEQYESTNMAYSLMCAKKEMLEEKDGIIVCYGDIVYEKRLVELMKNFKGEFGVLVDDEWLVYWKERLGNWKEDVESLVYDEKNNIVEIGAPHCEMDKAMARYVGMLKFSRKGCKKYIELFEKNRKKYWEKEERWLNSKSFKKAYMTDMLQALVDEEDKVKAVHAKRGWMEFDSVEDYEKAVKWAEEGSIKRFINLEG